LEEKLARIHPSQLAKSQRTVANLRGLASLDLLQVHPISKLVPFFRFYTRGYSRPLHGSGTVVFCPKVGFSGILRYFGRERREMCNCRVRFFVLPSCAFAFAVYVLLCCCVVIGCFCSGDVSGIAGLTLPFRGSFFLVFLCRENLNLDDCGMAK